MPNDKGVPSTQYLEKVTDLLKDDSRFKDTDKLSELLAYSCWRHDQPFKKDFFEQDTVEFSSYDNKAIDSFIERVKKFSEAIEQDEDNIIAQFAAVSHSHTNSEGQTVTHSHENGDSSHTQENLTGYKKAQTSNNSEEEQDNMFREEMAVALGLEKDASAEDIKAAVTKMQESQFTEEEKETLANLKYHNRVMYYMEEVESFSVVPGTQKEKAEKLATIEQKYGEEDVKERMAEWQSFQEAAETAKITETILSAHSESENVEDGPATAKIKKWAETNKKSMSEALAYHSTNELETFTEYWSENTPATNGARV